MRFECRTGRGVKALKNEVLIARKGMAAALSLSLVLSCFPTYALGEQEDVPSEEALVTVEEQPILGDEPDETTVGDPSWGDDSDEASITEDDKPRPTITELKTDEASESERLQTTPGGESMAGGDGDVSAADEVTLAAANTDPVDGFLSIDLDRAYESQKVPYTAPLTGCYTLCLSENAEGIKVSISINDNTDGFLLGELYLQNGTFTTEPMLYLEKGHDYTFTFCTSYTYGLTAALTLSCATTDTSSYFTIEDGVVTNYSGHFVNIVIPEGAESISHDGYDAMANSIGHFFYGPNRGYATVESCTVKFPASMKEISAYELNYHDSTKSAVYSTRLDVAEDSPYFESEDGVVYSKDGTKLIAAPILYWKDLAIPEGVKTVGEWACVQCEIGNPGFPDTLVTIEEGAFENSSASEVVLPDSVKRIGDRAFQYLGLWGSSSLKKLSLGNGVESIGDWAFSRMGDTELVLPEPLKSVGMGAFLSCPNLKTITFDSEPSFDRGVFRGCPNLSTLNINTDVYLSAEFFSDCPSLTNFVIGEDVTKWCVVEGNLASKSVESGGETSVMLALAPAADEPINFTIPDGITTVSYDSMTNVAGISSLTIGKDCISVGDAVEYNLSSIDVADKNPFYCVVDGVLCHCHYEGSSDGEVAPSTSGYDIVRFPMGSARTDYKVPEDIKEIEWGAFNNESTDTPRTLRRVSIPQSTRVWRWDTFSTKCEDEQTLTIAGYANSSAWSYYQEEAESQFLAWESLDEAEEPASVTITFDGNGSSFTKTVSQKKGELLGTLPDPTRVGYTLQGWYTSKTGGAKVTSTMVASEDVTYYARWSPMGHFPSGYSYPDDSYAFHNFNIHINEGYWATLYERGAAKLFARCQSWGHEGVCSGIAFTTASILNGMPSIDKFSTDGVKASCISNLLLDSNIYEYGQLPTEGSTVYVNKSVGSIGLGDFIKYAHISKASKEIDDACITVSSPDALFTINKTQEFLQFVKEAVDEGTMGIVVKLTNNASAHAVLVIGYDGNDILVDDSNNILQPERITIEDDGSWSFSGYGEFDSTKQGATLSYWPPSVTCRAWEVLSGGKSKLHSKSILSSLVDAGELVDGMDRLDANNTLVRVDADDYRIEGSDVTAVPIGAGEDGIVETRGIGATNMYWVGGSNAVTVTDLSGDSCTVDVGADDALVSATVSGGSSVSAEIQGTLANTTVVSPEGSPVSIACTTLDDEYVSDETLTVSGTALTDHVTVHGGDGAYLVTGLDEVTLELEGTDGAAETQVADTDGQTVVVRVGDTEDGGHISVQEATLENADIALLERCAYTGSAVTPEPVVSFGGVVLTPGEDYEVSYTDNVKVGTATVTINGLDAYEGTVALQFEIARADINAADVAAIAKETYNGKAIEPVPLVEYAGVSLSEGVDYTVSYENNVNAGTANITLAGKGNYEGTKTVKFEIVGASLSKATVSSIASQTYDGDAKCPKPEVKMGSRALRLGSDYTLAYKNNVNPGAASVTITGKGNYSGTKSVTFEIIAKTGKWRKSGSRWWYEYTGGSYPKSRFADIDGGRYYFDASGWMVTGWKQVGGKWYYFETSGKMAKNKWVQSGSKWCYLKADGTMATGWLTLSGRAYWMDANGYMVTGWKQIGGKWYYFESSGAMAKNKWAKSGSKWCYLKPDGKMATGWLEVSGKRYWMDSNGYMATGWRQISGKWYYFEGSGAMAKSKWVGNYYLKDDGTMATSKWIGNYHVNANGKWDQTR